MLLIKISILFIIPVEEDWNTCTSCEEMYSGAPYK
jgi:hypothetical protein